MVLVCTAIFGKGKNANAEINSPHCITYQRSITNSLSIWQEFAFNSAFSIHINLCGIFCGGLLTPTVWPKLVNLICQTILILSITNFLTLFGLRFVALFVWPNWLIYKWLLLRSVLMSFGLKSFGYSFFKIQHKGAYK